MVSLVGVAVLIDGGSVLLGLKSSSSGCLSGYWEFPGGKCEGSESVVDCIVRELQEEIGVDVLVGGKFADVIWDGYDHGTFRLCPHVVVLRNDIDKPLARAHVHEQLQWVPFGKVLTYPLLPSNIGIANALCDAVASKNLDAMKPAGSER